MADRRNKFLIKRSNIAGKVPTAGDLFLGEMALNTADVILYTSGTTANSILPIGWDRIHRTGDTMTGNFIIEGDLTVTGNTSLKNTNVSALFSSGAITASTYYGDGSNLINIPDNYTTATTVVDDTVYFDRTDLLSAFTMDLSGFAKNGFIGVQLSEKAVGKGVGFADEGLLDDTLFVVLFDDATTESMLLSSVVTSQVDLTENPRLAFTLFNTDVPVVTTSDTIYWEIDCRYIGDSESTNKAIDETLTGTTTFTGGTTNTRQITGSVDLDASLMAEFDIASFIIRRVPTNAADNYSGDAAVSSAWWIYKEKVVETLT